MVNGILIISTTENTNIDCCCVHVCVPQYQEILTFSHERAYSLQLL